MAGYNNDSLSKYKFTSLAAVGAPEASAFCGKGYSNYNEKQNSYTYLLSSTNTVIYKELYYTWFSCVIQKNNHIYQSIWHVPIKRFTDTEPRQTHQFRSFRHLSMEAYSLQQLGIGFHKQSKLKCRTSLYKSHILLKL